GFNVPRHSACCPLWPLFAVLGQPGLVLSERVTQLGRGQAPFVCYAVCEAQGTQTYNTPPLTQAVMLLVPAAEGSGAAREVGSTCRICPHEDCSARREPSILSRG
ncbi:MAG: short-chain fatty acyl-CoA regulator family protein, partial [Sulfitobacter sp.]